MMTITMRLRPRRALRWALLLVIVLFVLLNLHILPSTPESEVDYTEYHVFENRHHHPMYQSLDGVHMDEKDRGYLENVSLMKSFHPRIVIAADSNQTKFSSGGPNSSLNVSDVDQMKKEIERLNKEQHIFNLNKFGLKLGAESIVLVIQVHDRPEHLKILFDSLGKVHGIEHILLIISHDVFSHQLNELVLSITFCPVLQIFFPHSQQIYHDKFPGADPNDCPRDIKKDQALQKGCINAEHPDKYGHYREAKYCQAKHHWMWKLQFVFEHVQVLDGYEGQVLLLEDDYYLSEDILFSLQMMETVKNKDCPDCYMLVLGNYEKTQNYKINGGKMERAYWISSKHNMGMAFTKTLWQEIKKCAKDFCEFDDYNWDWTLQHISMKCIPNKIRLLKMKATRIFHIGECGMHTKSKNCDPAQKVRKAEEELSKNKQYLYPNTFTVDGDSRLKLRDPKPNGGWGDIRDWTLCKSFVNKSLSSFTR